MTPFDPERLRSTRQRKVLTQEELASKAGVRKATITELETGKRVPRPSTLRKIAHALGVRAEDFFSERT